MKYAVVLANGNPHIVKMNGNDEYETIGFASGLSNLEPIKELVKYANFIALANLDAPVGDSNRDLFLPGEFIEIKVDDNELSDYFTIVSYDYYSKSYRTFLVRSDYDRHDDYGKIIIIHESNLDNAKIWIP